MFYGNYWEFGWSCDGGDLKNGCKANGSPYPGGIRTDVPLPECNPLPECPAGGPYTAPRVQAACKLRSLCDTQLFMRNELNGSVMRTWSDRNGEDPNSVIVSGMEGAVIMDAGMPQHQKHLLRSIDYMIKTVPEVAGIAFDGTGWQGHYSLQADDGRSFVELHEVGEAGGPVTKGRAGWWQGSSKISIQEAVGEALHAAGKAQYVYLSNCQKKQPINHFYINTNRTNSKKKKSTTSH